jgi:uncharacterized DUF497 family protein
MLASHGCRWTLIARAVEARRPAVTSHSLGSRSRVVEEARSAFLDDNARVVPDSEHSEEEDRFILLGLSTSLRVLVVCHCYREEESSVRIISARKADREEQRQ